MKRWVRLYFAKQGALRFLSHHDLVTVFERAVRRARVPVAATQGFNPQLRLVFAGALALGIESQAEVLDLELRAPRANEVPAAVSAVRSALADELPEGLALLAAQAAERPGRLLWQAFAVSVASRPRSPMPALVSRCGAFLNDDAGTLPARRAINASVRAARRRWLSAEAEGEGEAARSPAAAVFRPGAGDTWAHRCRRLLAAPAVLVTRRRPGKPTQVVDLSRSLASCAYESRSGTLRLLIRAVQAPEKGATARAGEVLRALGVDPDAVRIQKTRMALLAGRARAVALAPPRLPEPPGTWAPARF